MSKSQVLNLRLRALPSEARARYNRLKAFAAAEAAAHDGAITHKMELIQQRQRADARVRELEAAGPLKRPSVDIAPDGTHTAGWTLDSELLNAARADVDALRDQIEAIDDSLRGGRVGIDVAEIDSWLVQQPSGAVWSMRAPSVTIKEGETPELRLEYVHTDLATLRGQLNEAEDAPLTVKEATAAFVNDVKARAAAAAPRLDGLFKLKPADATGKRLRQGKISWPTIYLGDGKTETNPDLIFWLFEKEIIARGKGELTALGSDDALSAEDRLARKADIKQAMHELAFEEQWLIDQIERKTGKLHSRRRGTPIDAILGIEIDSDADFG